MQLSRAFAVALLASVAGRASAESVVWEAASVPSGTPRHVLASGVKTYSPAKDIVVQERKGKPGTPASWLKALLLDENFALAASVHRKPRLDGFGLIIYRRGDSAGFSWEWFDRTDDAIFQKLQGAGRVSVTVKRGPDYEELESVTFLDDIVLRYLDDMSKPPETHTHEVVVRKGS